MALASTSFSYLFSGLEIFQVTEDGNLVTVVQFPTAIALRVQAFPDLLVVRVLLPESEMGMPTEGLMGIWNGNTADDLTDRNGVVQPESFQGILAFGNSCELSFNSCLFALLWKMFLFFPFKAEI